MLYVRTLATQLCPPVCPDFDSSFSATCELLHSPELGDLVVTELVAKGPIIWWHSIRTDRVPSPRAAPTGDCTVLQVYSHHDIPWILVSGQPSSAASRAFGALRHEGGFPLCRLTESEQRLVLREIAKHAFARVPKATAQKLLSVPTRLLKRRLTRWLPFHVQSPQAG